MTSLKVEIANPLFLLKLISKLLLWAQAQITLGMVSPWLSSKLRHLDPVTKQFKNSWLLVVLGMLLHVSLGPWVSELLK